MSYCTFQYRRITLLVIVWSLCACHDLRGQILPFRNYTTRDGLLSNQVNTIFQDSKGLIWIGTSNGISVFDGISFTNYTTINGLVNSNISSIVESRNHPGIVYAIGSTGGVCRFENGTFREIRLDQPASVMGIQELKTDEEGRVWCMTKEEIFIIEDSTASLVAPRTRSGNFSNLLLVHGVSAWIASDSTLSVYEGITANPFSREHDVYFRSLVVSLIHDRDSSVWVGTADSMVYEFQGSKIIHSRKMLEGRADMDVDDGYGMLWMLSGNNIWRIPKQTIQQAPAIVYPKENDLAATRELFATFDRENNLWLATWSKGVMLLPYRNQLRINIPIAGNLGSADTNGHLWVTSEGGVWEIFPRLNGLWDKYLHGFAGKSPDQSIYFLYVDPTGKLWINANAEPGAVKCYAIKARPGRESEVVLLRTVVPDSSTPDPHLHSVFVDHQQRLWSGVYPTGVVVRDLKTLRHLRTYSLQDSLPDNAVRTLFQDKDDNVWLGGFSGGLSVASGHEPVTSTLHKFTVADGLPDNSIRSLHEDGQGRLWIGTRYGGAAIYQNGRFQKVSMREGLQSNAVWSMTHDDRHRLWFGTDVGLECVNESTATPVRMNNDFLGDRVLSCGVYRNLFLWFVTIDGVTIDDYRMEVSDTIPPPIVITRFQANGKDMPVNVANDLSYEQNLCTIEFAGLSYKDPRRIRYQCKLEDIDHEWLPPTSHHAVTYATLQPGAYVFRVRAINGDGTVSRSPASLRFTIVPPFWRRWWFYALISCSVAGFLFALYRYRINKLLELERLRVRIASDLHDDVGSSLTRIAVHSEVIQTTTSAAKVAASSKEIGSMSREIISTLSDVVWSIDARHDSVSDLVGRIKAFALGVLPAKDIHLAFETDGVDLSERIPVDVRQNVYLITKEAVNNAAKYSEATEVKIRFERRKGFLIITIADNGKGLSPDRKVPGHGISNMKMRAERIRGTIAFENRPGLVITCTVRL